MNLVEANNMPLSDSRLKRLDYCLGYTLECAACLDIFQIWGLITEDFQISSKAQLQEIFKMLIGLKKSQGFTSETNESSLEYGSSQDNIFFNHERLQVYIRALEYISLLKVISQVPQITYKEFRSLDKHSISIVLNIAEGNGRYSSLDHSRFLNIAMNSTLKASVSLDLMVAKEIISKKRLDDLKKYLNEVISMLYKLDNYWKDRN